MGTDIHGVWQKKDGEKWTDIPSNYEQGRHYQLFAVLAGVRNGFGFAGCVTGKAVTPISEPKGLPDDFLMDGDDHPVVSADIFDPCRSQWYDPKSDDLSVWMGDHSHTWLSGQEMLSWYEKENATIRSGVIDREQFYKWDGTSSPDSWCGGVSGANVVMADSDDVSRKDWTHIRVSWVENLNESLAYFFDEVYRLVNEHDEIRFVFGFDS